MPTFRPSPDFDMHYEVDDFTDPWRKPETILMLHGNAESGLAWWAWVPHLARHYRVVRPDMRGFGQSTVAARRPERLKTLTVVGSPPPLRPGAAEHAPEVIRELETNGVEHWARQNMANRLGSAFPAEGFDFWCKFMGRTAVSTQLGFMGTIACADIRPDIPKIACPTLVITTEDSGLGSVADMRAWQEQIAGSELVVLPGNSYHVAATHADQSAAATLEFIGRRGG
jgi:3-oxoadipate enol-lactonase